MKTIMIVVTMLMPANLPLELVYFDHDMDRMPEWWILDASGKKVARFFDKQSAREFLNSYDNSHQRTKVQETQNTKGSPTTTAVESATRTMGTGCSG